MRMVMVEIGNEVVFINPRYVESIDYSLSKKQGCYEVRITTACKTWTLRQGFLTSSNAKARARELAAAFEVASMKEEFE